MNSLSRIFFFFFHSFMVSFFFFLQKSFLALNFLFYIFFFWNFLGWIWVSVDTNSCRKGCLLLDFVAWMQEGEGLLVLGFWKESGKGRKRQGICWNLFSSPAFLCAALFMGPFLLWYDPNGRQYLFSWDWPKQPKWVKKYNRDFIWSFSFSYLIVISCSFFSKFLFGSNYQTLEINSYLQ